MSAQHTCRARRRRSRHLLYSALLMLAVTALPIVGRPLISTQSGGRRPHRSAREAFPSAASLDARQLLDSAEGVGVPSPNVTSSALTDTSIPILSAAPPGLDALVSAYGLEAQPWTWDLPAPAPLADQDAGDQAQSALTVVSKRDEAPILASDWLSQNLNLYSGRVLVGAQNLEFVALPGDKSTANSTDGVDASALPRGALKVSYPKGSYAPSASNSKSDKRCRSNSVSAMDPSRRDDGSDTKATSAPLGGTSFYAQPFSLSPNSTSTLPQFVSLAIQNSSTPSRQALLLRYTVHVPAGFDFVKGGKLPGLYSSVGILTGTSTGSGPPSWDANTDGCSGGSRDGTGASCWSVRPMWRQDGQGEAYAYFATDVLAAEDGSTEARYDPCGTNKALICNDDYGTSMNRGSFQFRAGSATSVTLLVLQNSAPNRANGAIYLWADATLAIAQEGLLLRTGTVPTAKTGKGGGSGGDAADRPDADANANAQWVDKSSFFGGSTSDYAATADSALYFSDLQLYAGSAPSSLPGVDVLLTPHLSGNASAGAATGSGNGVGSVMASPGVLGLALAVVAVCLRLY